MKDRSESRPQTTVTEAPTAVTEAPVFLWASLGTPDNPPTRLMVEGCSDCAALVPVERFDQHGAQHRALSAAEMNEGR